MPAAAGTAAPTRSTGMSTAGAAADRTARTFDEAGFFSADCGIAEGAVVTHERAANVDVLTIEEATVSAVSDIENAMNVARAIFFSAEIPIASGRTMSTTIIASWIAGAVTAAVVPTAVTATRCAGVPAAHAGSSRYAWAQIAKDLSLRRGCRKDRRG